MVVSRHCIDSIESLQEPVLRVTKEHNMNGIEDSDVIKKFRKSTRERKRKTRDKKQDEVSLCEIENKQDVQIEKSDLDELVHVYQKCKKVMKKIEEKYGNLVNLNEHEDFKRRKSEYSDECTCSVSKKIVFDEMGNETVQDSVMTQHICSHKLSNNEKYEDNQSNNVQVEYDRQDLLPDNICSLLAMLRNPHLAKVYRNKIIKKVKYIQMGYRNQFRFEKLALISQVQSDPSDIVEFNGANLFEMSGYTVTEDS